MLYELKVICVQPPPVYTRKFKKIVIQMSGQHIATQVHKNQAMYCNN